MPCRVGYVGREGFYSLWQKNIKLHVLNENEKVEAGKNLNKKKIETDLCHNF